MNNLERVAKYSSLALSLIIGTVLGLKELVDVDIGWHLAGGLWILDSRQFPIVDPFGSEGRFWWCYSWLVEVLFAAVFKLSGFKGLQILQCASVLLVCFFLWKLVWSVQRTEKGFNPLGEYVLRSLALLLLIVLVSPIWHLRPQLYSFALFVVLIWLAESKRLTLRHLVPLTIFWANVHIYWLLVPLVLFVYEMPGVFRSGSVAGARVIVAKLLLCSFAALITPYPLAQFSGLWNYLFEHREAYLLISEFQPLSFSHGYLWWVWCLSLVAVWVTYRRLKLGASAPLFILFVIFTVASLARIKFVPLYGLIAVLLLVKGVGVPQIASSLQKGGTSSPLMRLSATVLIGVFIACAVLLVEVPKPLGERQGELAELSELVGRDVRVGRQVTVLNHFDDGGWLALFFYLQNKNQLRTAIDGRTLVMGEERLSEFRSLQSLHDNWCEILHRWNPRLAILPNEMELAHELLSGTSCDMKWSKIKETGKFIALVRRQ